MPCKVLFDNGNSISYVYDAAGTKLHATHTAGGVTATTEYCGNAIYENGVLSKLLTEQGYITFSDGKYHYFHSDHQGNVRVVTDRSGQIEEVNHYYPFGSLFSISSKVQPYKYNGKELDRRGGLDWYDYGARLYDASLGKWHAVDPLAEKYPGVSPYGYCVNNPVRFIDPDGRDVYRYDDKTGEMILHKKTDDKFDQIGKFKQDKKSGEYTLLTNKRGEAKTRIDNIEKGILSDGINFKENNNMIAVGGEGQATVGGVETFTVNLSDMVGKEIGGAYFSKDGAEATTHISIGRYENNSYKETKGHGHMLWNRLYPDSKLENSLTGFFHTHPSGANISVSDRTQPSEQDKRSRNRALELMPNLQFYILTHPINYGDKFPLKIPYTTWP